MTVLCNWERNIHIKGILFKITWTFVRFGDLRDQQKLKRKVKGCWQCMMLTKVVYLMTVPLNSMLLIIYWASIKRNDICWGSVITSESFFHSMMVLRSYYFIVNMYCWHITLLLKILFKITWTFVIFGDLRDQQTLKRRVWGCW
jgi:hypothetical protein